MSPRPIDSRQLKTHCQRPWVHGKTTGYKTGATCHFNNKNRYLRTRVRHEYHQPSRFDLLWLFGEGPGVFRNLPPDKNLLPGNTRMSGAAEQPYQLVKNTRRDGSRGFDKLSIGKSAIASSSILVRWTWVVVSRQLQKVRGSQGKNG
jgi:hypothetical protein